MSLAKPAVLTAGGAAGGGGITVGGGYAVHAMTRVTISQQLEAEGFKDKGIEESGAWSKMQTRITTKSKTKTDEDLKALTDENKTKAWCGSKKSETYGSSITANNDDLLKNVKTYCFLLIKEKLDGTKLLNFSDSNLNTTLSTLLNSLKSHTSPSPTLDTPKNKRVSEKTLSEIRSITESGSGALKKWCEEAYDLPFKGENSDTEYKLSKIYCLKNN